MSQALGSTPGVMQSLVNWPVESDHSEEAVGTWTVSLRIRDPEYGKGTAVQARSTTEPGRGRGQATTAGWEPKLCTQAVGWPRS